ncbi:MAG: CHASE2 domain-containing protein, partial [Bacteroidota bacterium]
MSTRETVKKFFFTKNVRVLFSAVFGIAAAWFIGSSSIGKNIELNALDLQFRLAQGSRHADTSIVILTIDQNSLQYFKRTARTSWPWPRDYYAITTDYLAKSGAKAIVYDFHFNEPDGDRVNSSTGAENDSAFARSIGRAGNVFLSTQLTHAFDEDQPGDTLISFPSPISSLRQTEQFNFDKTYAPLLQFQKAAHGVGVVNFTADEDGVCRQIPLAYTLNGKELYSLSFDVYRTLFNSSS